MADEYAGLDTAVGDIVSGRESVLRSNIEQAASTTPAQAAEYKHLADFTRTPLESVAAFPDDARAQAATEASRAASMVGEFPHLTKFLADPYQAAIASQDIERMKQLERAVVPRAFVPERDSILTGLGHAFLFSSWNAWQGTRMIAADMAGNTDTAARLRNEIGFAQKFQAQTAPQIDNLPGQLAYGAGSMLTSTTPQLLAALLNPIFGALTFGTTSGSEAYGAKRAAGLTPEQAMAPAALKGAIAAGTAFLPFKYVEGALGKAGMGEFTAKLLGVDIASMEAMTLADKAVDVIFDPQIGSRGLEPLKELPHEMLQAGVNALAFVGAMHPIHALAGKLLREDTANQDATALAGTLETASRLVTATELHKVDPEALADFLARAGGDSPLADVYVDPARFTEALQQAGISEVELANTMPNVMTRLGEARRDGTDVRIPVADYVVRFAGTPLQQALLPEVKQMPGGPTYREAQEAVGTQAERLKAEAAKLVEEKQNTDLWRESAQTVEKEFKAQLDAAGRFSSDVNAVYAKLFSSMVEVKAAQGKRTPEEQYLHYPLDVAGFARSSAPSLDQPTTGSARLLVEFGPDPNNVELKGRWDKLPVEERNSINRDAAEQFIPDILRRNGVEGTVEHLTGSFLDDTNPSVAIRVTGPDKLVAVGKDFGIVGSQMGVLAADIAEAKGLRKGWQLTLRLPEGADVDRIYQILHGIEMEDGSRPIQGQFTTRNGVMSVLNIPEWGGVPHEVFPEVFRRAVKALDGAGTGLVVDLDQAYYNPLENGKDYDYANRLRRIGEGTADEGSTPRLAPDEAGWLGDTQDAISEFIRKRIDDYDRRLEQPGMDGGGSQASGRHDAGDGRGNRQAAGDAVSVTGTHYSGRQRDTLDGRYYGTGLKGAERTRLEYATDERLKARVYFYVDEGGGVFPEGGVGGARHDIPLENLYDLRADALKIGRDNRADKNAMESAILDAGYDGYYVPAGFGNQGVAVVMGKASHAIPVRDTLYQSAREVKTDTPAFREWFGDSKIVDAEGKPTVMYHGTARDISVFEPKQANAIFLTAKPDFAEDFAHMSAEWKARNGVADGVGQNIMPVYVKAENPFDFGNRAHLVGLQQALGEKWWGDSYFNGEKVKSTFTIADVKAGNWDAIESQPVQDYIRANHDSFWVTERGVKNLAVFDPAQVKSINNRGTFDKDSPNILYQDEPFYSELARQVELAGMKNAPAQGWKDWLKSLASKGVKPDEIKWSGIEEWLDAHEGKVTKEEVQAYLSEFGVKVETVVRGDPDYNGRRTRDEEDPEYEDIDPEVTFHDWRTEEPDPDWLYENARDRFDEAKGERIEETYDDYLELAREDLASEDGAAYKGEITNDQIEQRARELAEAAIDDDKLMDELVAREEQWYWEDSESPATREITVDVGDESYDFVHEQSYGEHRLYHTSRGAWDDIELPRTYRIDDADIQGAALNYLMDEVGVSFSQEVTSNSTGALPTKWDRFVTGEAVEGSYRELLLTLPPGAVGTLKTRRTETGIETARTDVPDFRYDTHFPEANPIAHFRLNEHRDAEGKRIMVVQELQSDWGQQRREGLDAEAKRAPLEAEYDVLREEVNRLQEILYETSGISEYDLQTHLRNSKPADKVFSETAPQEMRDAYTELLRVETRRSVINRELGSLRTSLPPDAPFIGKTTQWAGLAAKRIVAYAVEHGFDKVVWTSGAQQVERWASGLRQNVDTIEWEKTPEGIHLIASQNGRERTNTRYGEGMLSDAIGKAMAKQIIEDPNQSGVISGDNITISDTGMAGFYDKMLPNIVNDVLKKLDKSVKVQEIEVKAPYEFSIYDANGGDGGYYIINEARARISDQYETRSAAEKALEKFNSDQSAREINRQLGFEITDKIRESAGRGLPLFHGDANAPRGQISFGRDITKEPTSIALLERADLSTFLHELGHWNLAVTAHMAADPEATPEIKADMDTLLRWFGVSDLATWHGMTLDEQRPYHEKFAKGFETYLFEGRAPNLQLQGLFSRVRAWMIHVYKSLTNIGVELTPEVRGVMDRMVASAEQINEAEKARGMVALFEEPPAGVEASAWSEYQRTLKDATDDALTRHTSRMLRDMKWLSGARDDALRALQRQAKTQRREITAEAERIIGDEPVYRAEEWLLRGRMRDAEGNLIETLPEARQGAKIDRAEVDALFPPGDVARPDLSALRGMTGDKGLHPDVVAEMFGFGSGRELIGALLSRTPRKDAVRGLTDSLMLERHGEVASPEAMARSAEAAIHNDLRARVIATEWRTLADLKGPPGALAKAAKIAAEETIAARRIRDIKPAQHEAAETRYAREADKAMKAGDLVAAAQAKRQQLVNNRLAKAALDALADVDGAVARFKALGKKTPQSNMRGEFLDQLNALLGRFDLRTSVKPSESRVPLSEWIAKEAERLAAVVPDLPGWVLNEAYRTHYKNLTVAEMRGLTDTIKQLEFMARREQKQYLAIRQMEFKAERGAVLDAIRATWKDAFDDKGEPIGIEPDFVPSVKKAIDKLGDDFAGQFLNPETLYTILGGKFGIVNESLFGRLSNRSDWKAHRLEKLYAEMKPYFDAYSLKERHDFSRKDIGTGTPADTALTRENALVVALLHGNPEGRERLANYGWSEAKQKAIISLLGTKDIDLANAIWRLFDTNLWPELKALNDRTRGKAPPKVEALPFETTGGSATGGYFRLKYDTTLDERAHRLDEGQAVKELLGNGFGMGSKTNQGTSTERKQNVSMRPRLDLGVFAETVNESVHDLAYREAIADTIRMLNDKGITNAIKQVVGTPGYRSLVNRVREVAAPPRSPSGFIEGAISIARRNTVINLMSGVKTALQNFTGLAPAFAEINAGTLMVEMAKFYGPKMAERYEFAMQHSAYLSRRFTSYDRDLSNAAAKFTVNGRLMPETSTFLALMGTVDKGVAVPVWNAAFRQGMERFANDTTKAIDYADHIVRQTQGSGREVDLPAIMAGHGAWGQLKGAFTMFYSYFNGQLNLLVKHGVISKVEARDNPALAVAKFTAKFIAIIAVPTILTEWLMNGVRQQGEDDKHWWMRMAGAFVRYGAGFFPLVRDVVPGVWTQLTGEGHYYGTKISPLDSAAESVVFGAKSAKNVATGHADEKDTKHLIMATGYGLGLPGKLVADTVEGTRQWLHGQAGPEAVVLGPPKKP